MARPLPGLTRAARRRFREHRAAAFQGRRFIVGARVHEVALAHAVWRQVEAEMARHEGRPLLAVNLLVGKWSGADPESLEFALGLLAADSRWPKAKVRTRTEPLVLACRACGSEFEPPELNLACPACGGADVEPRRGQDVYLESLEIE